jgi:hypothetical protein
MEKIRGDKPTGTRIHIYLGISQGNSLCCYLSFKLKCHVFHFLFSLFSPTKLEIRRAQGGEGWHQCEGDDGERGEEDECGAIKCVHM